MDMYNILSKLDAVEKKTLTESTQPVAEISDAEFDADALARHKSRLKREKTRMGMSMPKPEGGARKSDVPAAARAARGEEPLSLKDLDEAADKEIDYNSLEVDGIDYRDAPEFSDAYFSDGYYTDGTPLSDRDLEELSSDGDLLYQHVTDMLYEQDEVVDKEIDYNSLEVDGIDYRDAPEFSDAYFSDGYYTDGTPLSDRDLEELSSDGDLLYQHVTDMLYEDDEVVEGNAFITARDAAIAADKDTFVFNGRTYPVTDKDPKDVERADKRFDESKPDFLDLDGDGDRKESMKKAAADKKKGAGSKPASKSGLTAGQKKLPAGLQKAIAKKKTVKESGELSESYEMGDDDAQDMQYFNAIAALYGPDIWDNDGMVDLAQDLADANPSPRDLAYIISNKKLPRNLANVKFSNTDQIQFGDGDNYNKSSGLSEDDSEQLSELSPATLDSYRKKTDKSAYMSVDSTLSGKEKDDAQRKDRNQRVGRGRATNKLLAKDLENMSFESDSEQLRELSKDLLTRAKTVAGKRSAEADVAGNYTAADVAGAQAKKFKKAADIKDLSKAKQRVVKRTNESYTDFFDKKMAYQKIGATVDGSDSDYTVTFRDGTRKRYVEKDGRRRVVTLSPVDRKDDVDDEGNVVKRGRGRPAGTKRSLGAKGPTGRSKLMREDEPVSEASDYMNDLVKFAKVVQSAQNPEQLETAKKMGQNLLRKYRDVPAGKLDQIGKALGHDISWQPEREYDVKDELERKGREFKETIDPADRGEYDREGDMALNQLHQIADAAEELHSILDAEENLPEWVQSKITKAVDYIDTARDYLKAKRSQYQSRGEEAIAEKAVSKSQQQAAGAALAAKRGETPKSELQGASKEMMDMSMSDLEDFAKTKHKGLPDKKDESADKKSKKYSDKDEVDETTTSGSVATGGDKPAKADSMYGKGIYEGYEKKFSALLNEGMTVNMSTSSEGGDSVSVTATEEDAHALTDLLQMAGMFQSSGYETVDTEATPCSECGGADGLHESSCSHRMDEDYANEPDAVYGDMDLLLNKLSGGLNGPKKQVNPNNPGDNPLAMKDLGKKSAPSVNLEQMSEDVEKQAEQRLWDLYKRYE